mmetsp:Transcript_33844/g.77337  ORF Transcript_33844/g.77337 Transcript_33844/m.77337 type:complete len:371 (-) Transcript_33844:465-1577(-)
MPPFWRENGHTLDLAPFWREVRAGGKPPRRDVGAASMAQCIVGVGHTEGVADGVPVVVPLVQGVHPPCHLERMVGEVQRLGRRRLGLERPRLQRDNLRPLVLGPDRGQLHLLRALGGAGEVRLGGREAGGDGRQRRGAAALQELLELLLSFCPRSELWLTEDNLAQGRRRERFGRVEGRWRGLWCLSLPGGQRRRSLTAAVAFFLPGAGAVAVLDDPQGLGLHRRRRVVVGLPGRRVASEVVGLVPQFFLGHLIRKLLGFSLLLECFAHSLSLHLPPLLLPAQHLRLELQLLLGLELAQRLEDERPFGRLHLVALSCLVVRRRYLNIDVQGPDRDSRRRTEGHTHSAGGRTARLCVVLWLLRRRLRVQLE